LTAVVEPLFEQPVPDIIGDDDVVHFHSPAREFRASSRSRGGGANPPARMHRTATRRMIVTTDSVDSIYLTKFEIYSEYTPFTIWESLELRVSTMAQSNFVVPECVDSPPSMISETNIEMSDCAAESRLTISETFYLTSPDPFGSAEIKISRRWRTFF
jgi:hypothetical protein